MGRNIKVNNLKLRGYVTPEDFEGSDGERIQKAIDCAKKEDIAKVVLSGKFNTTDTIVIPGGMHVVFDNAVFTGNIQNEIIKNYSFESDRIYIEGKNSEIIGNIRFCHTAHVVLENLKITGNVDLELSRFFRIEYVEILGKLTLGRGARDAIIQHIKADSVLMSGEDKGYDIIGREPIIKNIVLRDSEIKNGVLLNASETCGFLNVQVNGVVSQTTCVTVGEKGNVLPKEQYQNMTFVDNTAPKKVEFNNEYTYAYID